MDLNRPLIPRSAKILVSVGDHTKAGETVVATWT